MVFQNFENLSICIMNLFVKVLIFACLANIAVGSKLTLPRVLLPLFKSSSSNFTLKVTNNGCYTW